MKFLIKKLKNLVHFFYAWYGAVKYGQPSEKLLVIGVTGTAGKSSTIYYLRQVLEAAGFKVGVLSTIEFCVAGKCQLNNRKMTMLGKMEIQRYLREMVDKKCDIAIVETTSEGRLQHRHRFINYDMMVLMNLYPEHIESHGSFEKYKQAKLDIFKYLSGCKIKEREKVAIVNGASEYADEFLQFPFGEKIRFAVGGIQVSQAGLKFVFDKKEYFAPLYGEHNAENLAAVISIAKSLDISEEKIKQALEKIQSPPGRIEFISEAEKHGFQVIVDYAFEPRALQALFDVVNVLQAKRIICVTGNCGGGRDKPDAKVKLIAKEADVVVVTNEDPYNDDPAEIIEYMAKVFVQTGKKENQTLFKVLDRKEGIKKALNLARAGDLVLVTGKGSEQAMCVAEGMIPWDDRQVVREVLENKKTAH